MRLGTKQGQSPSGPPQRTRKGPGLAYLPLHPTGIRAMRKPSSTASPADDARRARFARGAVVGCACSVARAALVGVVSVAAGAIIGSLALLASGLDSVIDGSASAILAWRFGLELRRTGHPGRAERLAAKAVGAATLAAAALRPCTGSTIADRPGTARAQQGRAGGARRIRSGASGAGLPQAPPREQLRSQALPGAARSCAPVRRVAR